MKNEVLGVDISKLTFDAYLHCKESYQLFPNNKEGFSNLKKWLKHNKIVLEELLICFEHTGLYSFQLSEYLSFNNIDYVMESAIQIKRSLGLVRGKNDKIDAKRIAEYAFMRRDKLKLSKPTAKDIARIEKLLSLRETMVKHRTIYKVLLSENTRVSSKAEHKCFFNAQNKLLKELNRQIDKIESEILTIMKSNKEMYEVYCLATSVKGVGFVLGAYFISTTSCFSKFSNGRKYSCYCGTAPFEYSSGTSLNLKKRVNHMANKRMKSLLNMAARCVIVHDPELKVYYKRKIEEGKNKMSTLNAVRNKIIHRVFAVVNRGTPFVTLQNHLS